MRQGCNVAVDDEPSRRNDLMEGGGGDFGAALSSSEIEKAINGNDGLRGFRDENTKIRVCRICNQRLLKFAMSVHCHEVHTAHVLEELEGSYVWHGEGR